MITIRFLRPYRVQDAEGRQYEAGEELTCRPDTAAHFTSRGLAEIVRVDPAPEPAPTKRKRKARP